MVDSGETDLESEDSDGVVHAVDLSYSSRLSPRQITAMHKVLFLTSVRLYAKSPR